MANQAMFWEREREKTIFVPRFLYLFQESWLLRIWMPSKVRKGKKPPKEGKFMQKLRPEKEKAFESWFIGICVTLTESGHGIKSEGLERIFHTWLYQVFGFLGGSFFLEEKIINLWDNDCAHLFRLWLVFYLRRRVKCNWSLSMFAMSCIKKVSSLCKSIFKILDHSFTLCQRILN